MAYDDIQTTSTLDTAQKRADDQERMGPLDRTFSPYVQWGLEKLTPDKYKDSVLGHYNKHRTAYNLGALGLLGAGGLAAYNGISNLLNSDPDRYFDPTTRSWKFRNSGGGGGFGNVMSYLAPVALLVGGGYLWNKYGDKVMDTFKNLGKANDFMKEHGAEIEGGMQDLQKFNRFKQNVKNTPVIGPVARNVYNWMSR